MNKKRLTEKTSRVCERGEQGDEKDGWAKLRELKKKGGGEQSKKRKNKKGK